MQGMSQTQPRKKYSDKEKQQLLANLDLEVAHRTRQFEEWLSDRLEHFKRRHETIIMRIPRAVRDTTMAEFAKYNGNVQECLKGLTKGMLGGEVSTIDKSSRKRKWIASQEAETEKHDPKSGAPSHDRESSRGVKSARTIAATPKKAGSSTGPGTAQRARLALPRTPGTQMRQRIPSGPGTSSPQKSSIRPPVFPRPVARPASPSKLPSPSKFRNMRPPSTASFNPVLPSQASLPRWPRKDERMLSVNGSPIANPYQLGLDSWLQTVSEGDGEESGETDKESMHGSRTSKKGSNIIVRPSTASQPPGMHSRTTSIGSHASHSRSNSQNNIGGHGTARANSSRDTTDPFRVHTPTPSLTALVSVPTTDGHLLEFDPLRTAPEEIDALRGISDSAKKQAKEDMMRLIQAAVQRWKIT